MVDAGGTQFIASAIAFGRNKLRPSHAMHDDEGVVATIGKTAHYQLPTTNYFLV